MVRLEFVTRLREQEKFENVDDLVAQITRDVSATRAALS
jgi:FAD synthase